MIKWQNEQIEILDCQSSSFRVSHILEVHAWWPESCKAAVFVPNSSWAVCTHKILTPDWPSISCKKKKFALCSPSFAEAPFSNSSDVSNLFANLNRPSFSAQFFFSVKSSSHFCDMRHFDLQGKQLLPWFYSIRRFKSYFDMLQHKYN